MSASASLFSRLRHPFVSTTPEQRSEVVKNVDDPLWHRFLEESERHFAEVGGLRAPRFPVFCHNGDLDEVMATVILAYVRQDRALWRQVGDWVRTALAYHRQVAPEWKKHLAMIPRGIKPPTAAQDNLGQFFDSLSPGSNYFVEGGLMVALLHLYDMLEGHAPDELSGDEKEALDTMLGDFAVRYALHEEAYKYSNRGLWANNGVLVSGLVSRDPERGKLLVDLSWRRYREFRSTFFDDGAQHEGSMGYQVMSIEGIFYYALMAANVFPDRDPYGATARDEAASLYLGYPGYVDLARAYFHAAIPGPTLRQSPRGSSESIPLSVSAAFLHAYALSGDPELGWFLQQRAGDVNRRCLTPMKVTPHEALGLGMYEPLKNFWVYRPVTAARPPRRLLDVLPQHGGFFSRSGWDAGASCVSARFGFEGTAKSHADHAHVALSVAGVDILSDPFPRIGPKGHNSSVFHNTVTLDNAEPTPVIGTLAAQAAAEGADGLLIFNEGGELPRRIFLHDPRDDFHRWFLNHPRDPGFIHRRAVLHAHGRGLIVADRIERESSAEADPHIDWFFHSKLKPRDFAEEAPEARETYRLRPKAILDTNTELEVSTRGPRTAAPGEWTRVEWEQDGARARLDLFPVDSPIELSFGRHHIAGEQGGWDQSLKAGETNYFVRGRQRGLRGRAIWAWSWVEKAAAPEVEAAPHGGLKIGIGGIEAVLDREFSQLQVTAKQGGKAP